MTQQQFERMIELQSKEILTDEEYDEVRILEDLESRTNPW